MKKVATFCSHGMLFVAVAWLAGFILFPSLYLAFGETTSYKNGHLSEIIVGRFENGTLNRLRYERHALGETVTYYPVFGKSIYVGTDRLTGEIDYVSIGNNTFTGNAVNDPEVLREARKILELGRQYFQEAQDKSKR